MRCRVILQCLYLMIISLVVFDIELLIDRSFDEIFDPIVQESLYIVLDGNSLAARGVVTLL